LKEEQSKIPSVPGLVRDAGWYGLVPIVQKAIGLVLVPIYTFYLSPADYGVIALIALIVGIPKLLADWGVTWSIQRDYLGCEGDEAREYLFTALIVNVASSIMAYGVFFLLGRQFVPLIAPEWEAQYTAYLNLSLMAAMLSGVSIVVTTYLVIERRPQAYSIFQLAVYVVASTLQLYLLIGLQMGLMAVFLTQLLSAAISAIGGLGILWPHLKPRFRLDAARSIAEFGWQVTPSHVLNYMLKRGDQWVIQSMLSLDELGLYSFGLKFLEVMGLYSSSVHTAWRPTYFRQLNEGVPREVMLHYGNVLFEISILFVLTGMLFAKEVIIIFAAPKYHPAYVVAAILMGYALVKVAGVIPGSTLVYEKRVYLQLTPILVIGVIGVGLGILVVPEWGIEGVALARLISAILQFSVIAFLVTRYTQTGLPIDWKRWLGLAGLMVGVILTAFAFDRQSFWAFVVIKALLWLGIVIILLWLERAAVARQIRRLATSRFASDIQGGIH
jgi:O-antigen/teichoic acid export membrane protein